MIEINLKFFLTFCLLSVLVFPVFSQNSDEYYAEVAGKMYQYTYSNKDSTYYYANKLIVESKKEKNYKVALNVYLYSNKSAIYFNDYNQIKKNLQDIDELIYKNKTYLDTISDIEYIKNAILYDKSNYYYKLNNYKVAKNHLEKIISNITIQPDSVLKKKDLALINGSYNLIAKMYSNDGKYKQAKDYYTKSIRINNNISSASNTYRLIGELYKRQKDYKTSNSYLKKALNYSLNESKDENSIINEANSIVENFIALKQPESASIFIGHIKPYKDSNKPYGFMFYKLRAKLRMLNKNYERVENDFATTIALLKNKWKGFKHPEIANAYQELSNFYFLTNDFSNALMQNQLAIDQVHGKNVINSSINNSEYLKLLKDRINIETKAENYNNAITTSTLALSVLDSLKPSFKDNTDKMLLVDNAFPIFENSLNALSELNRNSKNNDYTKKAFNLIEKSKSVLLLEALLSAKATNYANIPETVIEQEQLFKTEITTLEKRLERSKNEALEEELFKQKNDYIKFINNLETNYKSYYNLKYNTKVVNIEGIKQFLGDDDKLLSYFFGESALYVINITKGESGFSKIDVDENFNNLIKKVYNLLGNPKSDLQLLNSKSYALYSKILAPYLKNNNKKNLIILPDGLLNYIPFGSLATNKSNNYLVEDYAISYANSATLLLQLQDKKDNNKQVLAFAPTFKNTNLLALPNNTKEANQVLNHFKGQAFKNNTADLEHFNAYSSNYSILHLATHAIYNDVTPENSYLAFAKNDTKDNALYVRDLYNLKLNADLVTLSACESGIGNLNRGEGLMSLARGFYFSGANSIASTLWKINDASSTRLMDGFYLNLSEHQSKNIALQKAQVNFINNNRGNALRHPYYWSGFVISGNTIALNTTKYWPYIAITLVLTVLLLLYFKRRN